MSMPMITAEKASPFWTHVIAAAVLALLIFWTHGWAMQGGWRVDDAGQLIVASKIPTWQLLFDPSGWREFNPIFFTPWLALAYKFDQWMFGRTPAAHYAHVLISVWFVSWLTFAVLRRYVGSKWALWASVLFVLSAPIAAVVQFIPARHYVEGLTFALLAVQCHLQGAESGRYRWYMMSALCYLLAALFKEIFAPLLLPLVVLSLSSRDCWRNRLALAGLYGGAALLYVYWRSTMVGAAIGGYHGTLDGFWLLPQKLVALPWPILGAPHIDSILALALVLISFAIVALRNRRVAWGGAIVLVAVMAPFSALQGMSDHTSPLNMQFWEYRLYILPTWVLCIGSVCILTRLQGRTRYLAIATAVTLSVAVARQTLTYSPLLHEQLARYDAQAKFAETHSGDALLLTSDWLTYHWVPAHLELRPNEIGQPAPIMIHTKPALKRVLAAEQRIWAYDPKCKCVAQVSEAFLQKDAHRYRALARKTEPAPLAMFFKLQTTDMEVDWERLSPVQGETWIQVMPGGHFYSPPKNLHAKLPAGGRNFDKFAVYFDDHAGHEMETEWLPFPKNSTLYWHMGVFVVSTLAEEFKGPVEEGGRCAVETLGGDAGGLDHKKPIQISAWMTDLARKNEQARDVAMTFSQRGEIKYLAFLHRDPKSGDALGRTHLAVLDADLTRVRPDDYDVDLVGRSEDGRFLRCKTGRSVKVF